MSLIDMAAILAPIPGERPEGIDLRYTVYSEIREARRADEPLARGEWERELKTAEWGKVISLSLDALTTKSKDLQIATWLAEGLTQRNGFEGLAAGLAVLAALLEQFWDEAYPRIEDDDYDGRAAPFEFLNDRVSLSVRQIAITDPRSTPGYSYLKWQESREVAAARGEVREQLVSDGKPTPEEFDAAVAKSPAAFYRAQADALSRALEQAHALEAAVDQKFGRHAPTVAALIKAVEECRRQVLKICTEQKGLKDALSGEAGEAPKTAGATPAAGGESAPAVAVPVPLETQALPGAAESFPLPAPRGEVELKEAALWNEALAILQKRSFKEALDLLLAAASSQSSERGRCRYRFLVAKLCLRAGRPDLARPIVEKLHTEINELQLERWECPFWICEILEALHQCLIAGEDADDEAPRARELFRKICTMDVTKALGAAV